MVATKDEGYFVIGNFYTGWGRETGDFKNQFSEYGEVGGIASPDILMSTLCHSVTMEQCSGAQRALTVKEFHKSNDRLEAARRLFRIQFNLQRHDPVPSAHAIKTWVRNFEETGSALKKKPPGGIRSARAPDSIAGVRTALIRSPKRFLHVGIHCR
jgi:hypothetical protein